MPEKANLNLVYSSLWSPKELAMTERLSTTGKGNIMPIISKV